MGGSSYTGNTEDAHKYCTSSYNASNCSVDATNTHDTDDDDDDDDNASSSSAVFASPLFIRSVQISSFLFFYLKYQNHITSMVFK